MDSKLEESLVFDREGDNLDLPAFPSAIVLKGCHRSTTPICAPWVPLPIDSSIEQIGPAQVKSDVNPRHWLGFPLDPSRPMPRLRPLAHHFAIPPTHGRRAGGIAALLVTALFAAGWLGATPAPDAPDLDADRAAIVDLIGRWYAEQRAGNDGHPWRLTAPGLIDTSPGYYHASTESKVLGPRIYHSLAATALVFRHEIERLRIDPNYARVDVWERGYSYAWTAQRTTERAGQAVFVLERQPDGRWLVLAHRTNTVGIPPGKATDPLPDLRDLFYSTVGADRDPEADAAAARQGR